MAEKNPFEDLDEPEANPFAELDEPKEGHGGYLKAIGQGLKNVISNYALAPGYAEAAQMNMEGVPNPLENDITLAGPVPKEPSEHPFITNLAGAAFDPLSWAGPGGLISKAAGIVGSTLGGEAGRNAAKGSAFEIPAELAGSFAGAHAALAPGHIAAGPKPIAPDRQALIDTLKGEGVTSLTAGQQRGSKGLRYLESITADSPLSGTGAEEINEAGKKEFTRAVLKRMGEDADAATPDVIERARVRIGNKLDEVADKLPVKFTGKFGNDLSEIAQDLTKEGLAPEQTNRIMTNLNNVRGAFITKAPAGGLDRTMAEMRANAGTPPPTSLEAALQQGVDKINATPTGNPAEGIMPGKAYQMLTRKDTPLDRLVNSQNPDERFYGGRIRDALDDAMSKTAVGQGTKPGKGRRQALADLLEARRQWRTMVMASKAVAGGGEDAAKGYISPAQLRMQLAGNQKDKLLYARGGGMRDLNDLSRAGNAVMTPLPNSGTSQREQAREMFNLATTLKGAEGGSRAVGGTAGYLLGGVPGAIAGAAAGPFATGMGGRILHSQPVQKYLTNSLPGQQWVSERRPGASPAWLSMVNVLHNREEKQ